MDWMTRIDRLEAGIADHDAACADARSWTTCMCGQQDKAIERVGGVPTDRRLATLGIWFAAAITQRKWLRARVVGEMIQTRAAEVLAFGPQVKRETPYFEYLYEVEKEIKGEVRKKQAAAAKVLVP